MTSLEAIHILRKHFFFKSTTTFSRIFCALCYFFLYIKKNTQKVREYVAVDKKNAYVIYEWPLSKEELPWIQYYNHGLEVLCDHEVPEENTDGLGFVDQGWLRPDSETDKLYMSMGGGDIIEVGHPTPRDGQLDPRYYLQNNNGNKCYTYWTYMDLSLPFQKKSAFDIQIIPDRKICFIFPVTQVTR